MANGTDLLVMRHNYVGFMAHNGLQIQNCNPGAAASNVLLKSNLSRHNYGCSYATEQYEREHNYFWIPESRKGMRGIGYMWISRPGSVSTAISRSKTAAWASWSTAISTTRPTQSITMC